MFADWPKKLYSQTLAILYLSMCILYYLTLQLSTLYHICVQIAEFITRKMCCKLKSNVPANIRHLKVYNDSGDLHTINAMDSRQFGKYKAKKKTPTTSDPYVPWCRSSIDRPALVQLDQGTSQGATSRRGKRYYNRNTGYTRTAHPGEKKKEKFISSFF